MLLTAALSFLLRLVCETINYPNHMKVVIQYKYLCWRSQTHSSGSKEIITCLQMYTQVPHEIQKAKSQCAQILFQAIFNLISVYFDYQMSANESDRWRLVVTAYNTVSERPAHILEIFNSFNLNLENKNKENTGEQDYPVSLKVYFSLPLSIYATCTINPYKLWVKSISLCHSGL